MQQKILDNRYELERKIGEGGMARVYSGRDLKLNRRVAVKVLHRQYVNDADFLGRFRHEALAAAILNHPSIVDVYDVGQDGDIHYIVMEYVEGTDLKSLINREGPLPIPQAVAIAEQVAQGLVAAHRANMLHRDIKPQNIIVTPDGQVRITDFGIAKSQFSTSLTQTGITYGTVDYIAPEQAQGKPSSPRSDLYSLGITLYEMVTGRLPFTGENAVAIAMQHATAEPPPPRRFNSQIPPQLEALILRTLAKDPERRPSSADEFARMLAPFRDLGQQATVVAPVAPHAPSPPTPVHRPAEPPAPKARPAAPHNGGQGRVAPPPPPLLPSNTRAPQPQSAGCGIFVVGMLVLVGVLGLVLLFFTGQLDGVFAGRGQRPAPTATQPPIPGATATIEPTTGPLVLAPSLVNLTAEQAQGLLQTVNLTPVPQPQNSAEVLRDHIISQAIAPGTRISAGTPFTFTVSTGPTLVEVPDLTRRRVEAAQQEAQTRGLTINVVQEPSIDISEGFVIRQEPRAGLLLAPNESITLVVSIGDKVRFPNIIGMTRSEAETALTNTNGLVLSYVDVQGRDRLGAEFDRYGPNQVISAQVDNAPVANGNFVRRGGAVVLGVRAEN